MNGFKILKSKDEVLPFISRVQAEADAHRETFGFLPANTYEEQAAQGKLWIAVNGAGEYVGHLMFGGKPNYLKIVQLYVFKEFRGQGIAPMLLDSLVELGEARGCVNISARVASDLASNHFYTKYGFEIARQVKGGATTKRIINVQVYELNTPSLFDCIEEKRELDILDQSQHPALRTPQYAFDLNIVYDIIKDNDFRKISGLIFKLAQNGEFKLCATKEFITELERNSKTTDDPFILFATTSLPIMTDEEENVLQPIITELNKQIFTGYNPSSKTGPNKESDLRHLAHCIVKPDISGFITRDKALLNARDFLKKDYELDVLAPSDFCFDFDELPDSSFEQSDVSSICFKIDSLPSRKQVQTFIEKIDLPIRINDFWEKTAEVKDFFKVAVMNNNDIIGLATCSPTFVSGREFEAHIFVDEHCSCLPDIVDHLLEKLQRTTLSSVSSTLHIKTMEASEFVIDTLIERNYANKGRPRTGLLQFQKISAGYYVAPENWGEFLTFFESKFDVNVENKVMLKLEELKNTGLFLQRSELHCHIPMFDLESYIAPTLILHPDRTAVMMTIKPFFSRQLLGNTSMQGEFGLFDESEALLHLEKAYFMKPRNIKIFSKGSPVIFYESGNGGRAIGWARITTSGIYPIEDTARTFSRQGVLDKEQLATFANKKGEVQVVTFDNFVEFHNKLTAAELKAIGCDNGSDFVTSQVVKPEAVSVLAERAFNINENK